MPDILRKRMRPARQREILTAIIFGLVLAIILGLILYAVLTSGQTPPDLDTGQ